MHIAYNPDLAAHTTRRTTPAPDPHQSALRRICHLHSAGLPARCLIKLQFRDWLSIDTGVVQQPIMPEFVACAAAASSGEIRGLAARGRLPHWQPARCAKPASERNCQAAAEEGHQRGHIHHFSVLASARTEKNLTCVWLAMAKRKEKTDFLACCLCI